MAYARADRLKLLLLGLAVHILAACQAEQPPAPPTATRTIEQAADLPADRTELAGFFIAEQDAVAQAIGFARQGRGHLGGALEAPSHRGAELLTFASARQQLIATGWADLGQHNPELMVWLVTLDGTWRTEGGPLPAGGAPAPTIQVFHELAIVLNASSGTFVSLSAR